VVIGGIQVGIGRFILIRSLEQKIIRPKRLDKVNKKPCKIERNAESYDKTIEKGNCKMKKMEIVNG
jgi:hypothetical protein